MVELPFWPRVVAGFVGSALLLLALNQVVSWLYPAGAPWYVIGIVAATVVAVSMYIMIKLEPDASYLKAKGAGDS